MSWRTVPTFAAGALATLAAAVSNHQSNSDPMVHLRMLPLSLRSYPSASCSGSGYSVRRCALRG